MDFIETWESSHLLTLASLWKHHTILPPAHRKMLFLVVRSHIFNAESQPNLSEIFSHVLLIYYPWLLHLTNLTPICSRAL